MHYKVRYYCWCHTGKCRSMNQDNFICADQYLAPDNGSILFPLKDSRSCSRPFLLGVFDGMGGEECGEVASLIAAECASEAVIGDDPIDDLIKFFNEANKKICDYAANNEIGAMGTTAAVLAFNNKEIALCNIGDSKIFRFAHKKLEQISVDHYSMSAYGVKPPLSQNLGIPPSELLIDPYVAKGRYHDGDVYLICSDGLTDMVPIEDITRVLKEAEFKEVGKTLLGMALDNGGKDNITMVLCKVERERWSIFDKMFRSNDRGRKEKNNEK